jgi:uncharacterized membrane protein HdeD (DUF308 family)
MEMATTTMNAEQATAKNRPWWLTLIQGIAALVIGVALLWSPGKSNPAQVWLVLVQLLGIYWMVEGIFDIISIFIDHTMWGWKLFIGIISILAGSSIVMYPIAAAVVLPQVFVLVLGIWGLIYGCVLLFMAFKGAGWGAGILGALGILFGMALTLNYTAPGMGLSMLWSAAVCGVIGGIMLIVQAFRQKSA